MQPNLDKVELKGDKKRVGGSGGDLMARPTPDPGLGSSVELSRRDACGLLDLIRGSKTLSSQSIAAEEPPPALLQIESAGTCGNEDLMEPRMLCQPGAGLSTVVAGEIVGDDEDAPAALSASMSFSKAM